MSCLKRIIVFIKDNTYILVILLLIMAVLNYINSLKIRSQIPHALKLEFLENQKAWEENHKVLTEDRGGLQQNETKEFFNQSKRWNPMRRLNPFSFNTWQNVKSNYTDILNQLKNDGGALLREYYSGLKEIQIFKDEREQYRASKLENSQNPKWFESLNQNVILAMDKNKSVVERVQKYFEEYYPEVTPEDSTNTWIIVNRNDDVIRTQAVTGDSVTFASGVTGATTQFHKETVPIDLGNVEVGGFR